jgi:hypothetical protein
MLFSQIRASRFFNLFFRTKRMAAKLEIDLREKGGGGAYVGWIPKQSTYEKL